MLTFFSSDIDEDQQVSQADDPFIGEKAKRLLLLDELWSKRLEGSYSMVPKLQ